MGKKLEAKQEVPEISEEESSLPRETHGVSDLLCTGLLLVPLVWGAKHGVKSWCAHLRASRRLQRWRSAEKLQMKEEILQDNQRVMSAKKEKLREDNSRWL